jgi:hypothetical protein
MGAACLFLGFHPIQTGGQPGSAVAHSIFMAPSEVARINAAQVVRTDAAEVVRTDAAEVAQTDAARAITSLLARADLTQVRWHHSGPTTPPRSHARVTLSTHAPGYSGEGALQPPGLLHRVVPGPGCHSRRRRKDRRQGVV